MPSSLTEAPSSSCRSGPLNMDGITSSRMLIGRTIPKGIDVQAFRLMMRGLVSCALSLPPAEQAAVDQGPGSRDLFLPCTACGQWAGGDLGACRIGLASCDVLDRIRVNASATQVHCKDADEPVVDEETDFMDALDLDHARDGAVIIVRAVNDELVPDKKNPVFRTSQ